MTRDEHVWKVLEEECAEVARRVSKLLRFGRDEVEPGQPYYNAERVLHELDDLDGVREMLEAAGLLPTDPLGSPARRAAKREKVEKYLAYGVQCGTVSAGPATPPPPLRPPAAFRAQLSVYFQTADARYLCCRDLEMPFAPTDGLFLGGIAADRAVEGRVKYVVWDVSRGHYAVRLDELRGGAIDRAGVEAKMGPEWSVRVHKAS